jgi:hypothetical protein
MSRQNPGTHIFFESVNTMQQRTPTLIFFRAMYTGMKIGCMKLFKIDSRLHRPYTCITVGLAFHHFLFTASYIYAGAQMMSQQQQCTCTLPLHTYYKMFRSGFRCSGTLHCVVRWVVLNVLKDQPLKCQEPLI